jgi:hypothetical protein
VPLFGDRGVLIVIDSYRRRKVRKELLTTIIKQQQALPNRSRTSEPSIYHRVECVNMDVDLTDEAAQRTHLNGSVPSERPQTELTKANHDAAQLQRRKEAEKAYGRGRKIPGM